MRDIHDSVVIVHIATSHNVGSLFQTLSHCLKLRTVSTPNQISFIFMCTHSKALTRWKMFSCCCMGEPSTGGTVMVPLVSVRCAYPCINANWNVGKLFLLSRTATSAQKTTRGKGGMWTGHRGCLWLSQAAIVHHISIINKVSLLLLLPSPLAC